MTRDGPNRLAFLKKANKKTSIGLKLKAFGRIFKVKKHKV